MQYLSKLLIVLNSKVDITLWEFFSVLIVWLFIGFYLGIKLIRSLHENVNNER